MPLFSLRTNVIIVSMFVLAIIVGVALVAADALGIYHTYPRPLFSDQRQSRIGVTYIVRGPYLDSRGTYCQIDEYYNVIVVFITRSSVPYYSAVGDLGCYTMLAGTPFETRLKAPRDLLVVVGRGRQRRFFLAPGEAERIRDAMRLARPLDVGSFIAEQWAGKEQAEFKAFVLAEFEL